MEKTEKKRPAVEIFSLGLKCKAMGCSDCIDLHAKDVGGKEKQHPPIHDGCDCVVTKLNPEEPCTICHRTVDQIKNTCFTFSIKNDEADDEKAFSVMICGACLYMSFKFIDNMMLTNKQLWMQIVAIEEKKIIKKSPIILPPTNKVIRPQ